MRATDDLREWGDANPADTPPGQFAELCDALDAKFAALVEACEAIVEHEDGDPHSALPHDTVMDKLRAALRAAKGDA